MERIHIAQIFADQAAFGGKTVTVCGWAKTIRDMKNFGFVELNDGSCFKNLQVVMDRAALDNYDDIAGQNVGAALIVTGVVALTPEAKQPLELKAESIAVEGPSTAMVSAFSSRGCLASGVRVTTPVTISAAPTFCPAMSS